jgi:hypothetical protein
MGVATSNWPASATVGDWSGDCAGTSSNRVLTSSGGSRGVVANRSFATSSGSNSNAFALEMSMSIGDDVGRSSTRSRLLRAVTGNLSLMSNTWLIELLIDDVRVDGTRDGVALREERPSCNVEALLRSLTLRDSDGNRRSILLVRLCGDGSADRRRLGRCTSGSLLK